MELTKNLKLKKPAQEDFYNVDDFNANADTLDNEVQNIKNSYVPLKGDYIKNLSVNGDTVTYVKGNGTAGSFKTKTYSKLSEFTNDTGYITKNDTCAGATNDGNGRNIVNTYATKAENSATLTSAKNYTDTEKAKYLPLAGGRMSGYIYRNVDNDAMMVTGGSAVGNGASLCLQGKSHTSKGGFFIRANDGSTSIDFKGTPNGDLVWHGKNIVRSVNGVSADINGNVSISRIAGDVRTINGIGADGNGNVNLPLPYLPLSGGALTNGRIISRNVNNDCLRLYGGIPADSNGKEQGALLILNARERVVTGTNVNNHDICATLRVNDLQGNLHDFSVSGDGQCCWEGKHIVRSVNGINADASGNVSGIVTTATAQTISAQHNFSGGVKISGTLVTIG